MKKRLLSLLALMSVAGIFAQSQIYDINGIYYRLIQDPDSNNASDLIASVTTMGETNYYQGSISIPSSVTINGINYTVGEINDMAFKTCKSLTQIVIPASIKHIPHGAFYGCENLTSIVVANDNPVYDSRDNCNAVVETATNTLIAGCKNTFISSNTTGIGEAAFYGCKGLVSINLPYSITSIGKWAFLDCTALTSVAIPSSMTSIETGVFEGCTNLASIKIPASVTTIGDNAFSGCINLAIEIPTTITNLSGTSFDGIKTLYWNSTYSPAGILNMTQPNTIVFGDNVTSIDRGTFNNCHRLKSISIPASVVYINARAFEGLYDLEHLYWNSKVALSKTNILENSKSTLKSFVLGDSVTNFDWIALVGCSNLESLSVEPGNPVYDSRDNCNAIIESIDTITWYDPDYDYGRYYYEYSSYYYNVDKYSQKVKNRLILGCKNTVIPNNITCIGGGSFSNCNIESIVIPNSITNIEYGAFAGCTNLKSLFLPASVNNIDGNIIQRCTNLETIKVDSNNMTYDSRNNCNAIIETSTGKLIAGCKNTFIPSGVTKIENYAFNGCIGLTSMDIPSSITSIGEGAFFECSGLENILLPDGITEIAVETFHSCSSLTSIVLPSNLKAIKYIAFSGCSSLESIIIPSGVTRIYNGTFSGCSSLKSIILSANVDTIDSGAFWGCSSLTSIDIPSKVNYIGSNAFRGCSSLLSLTIPDGVKIIEPYLVAECGSLKTINIPSSIDSVGQYAFAECSSLESIIIPEGVKTINYGTFNGCGSLSYLSLPSTLTRFKGDEYDYDYELNNWNSSFFDVFAGCNNLTTAGPKGGGYNYEFNWQDTIPANAFRGLNNLRSVYIPKTIKAIYECDVQANTAINNSAYNTPNYDYYGISFNNDCGSVGTVFYGCDSLQSVAVSFKNTKLMRLWRDEEYRDSLSFNESPMDFNLYKLNPVQSITILDDSINDLSSILTQTIKEIVVSEYVQYVDLSLFRSGPQTVTLDRLYYNADIGLYRPRMFDLASNLEKITVESGNTRYSSFDGVLLNKDGSRLLLCPSKRKDGYRIPETVITVDAASFKGCKDLKFVNIPSSVELIGERAFEGCNSIDWVSFEGSPKIGFNAFNGCQNIHSVTAHSYVPGIMDLYDSPQTVMTGDYEQIALDNTELILTPICSDSLDRTITRIKSNRMNWICSIKTDAVMSGQYRIIVGILPSIDGLPSFFHPIISGYNIYNGIPETIFDPKQKVGRKMVEQSFSNNILRYDSIVIAEALTIPEGYDYITIGIKSSVNNTNLDQYSNSIMLDRIFFEPIGDDFPEDAYAGPFTQKVFNNAMLYVPDGAVDTYRAADGWKLFKNICIDDAVDPITLDKINEFKDRIIYDTMGRKVETESIEQLAPGLYIIGGSTFLIQ